MIITDCLYGTIDVGVLCRRFMDTKEFQRLRAIQQTGLVSFVFPTCTHTRFEHSIGVMHLAGVMCKQLNISKKHRPLIELAGLFHDVGHLAFSHTMEKVLPKKHEQRGVEILASLNARLGILTDEEVEFVSMIILGKHDASRGLLPFMTQIIHNEDGYDVDRMDYLQRDQHALGLKAFRPGYIIKCAYVSGDDHLLFYPKASQELQQMDSIRRYMYDIVYYHKKVKEIETGIVYYLKQLNLREELALMYTDQCMIDMLAKTFPDEMDQFVITRKFPDVA